MRVGGVFGVFHRYESIVVIIVVHENVADCCTEIGYTGMVLAVGMDGRGYGRGSSWLGYGMESGLEDRDSIWYSRGGGGDDRLHGKHCIYPLGRTSIVWTAAYRSMALDSFGSDWAGRNLAVDAYLQIAQIPKTGVFCSSHHSLSLHVPLRAVLMLGFLTAGRVGGGAWYEREFEAKSVPRFARITKFSGVLATLLTHVSILSTFKVSFP